MSVFVCALDHISAIVRWASLHSISIYHGNPSRKFSVQGSEDAAVGILYAENIKSFNKRYSDTDGESCGSGAYRASAKQLEPVEVIKLVGSLAYQSCEHEGWESSLAKALLYAIERKAITMLPGYDSAPWRL